jgi:hypothetical protein
MRLLHTDRFACFALRKVNLLETTFDQEGAMNRRKFKALASLSFALILELSGIPCGITNACHIVLHQADTPAPGKFMPSFRESSPTCRPTRKSLSLACHYPQ